MQSQGIQDDGTLGRKQFYEARGYAVSDCYNQNTDNNGGGFGFSQYQAEINAGNPVLLNLAGHSIVGLGYDAASRTVYLHDTWDRSTYGMPWGGDYLNMTLLSVSIVHIASPGLPGVFSESVPSNGASGQPTSLTLRWGASSQAAGYEVCYDQTNDNACANWIDTGTATQLTVSGLTTGASYTWQVRARNASGVTYASNAAWWRFQTRSTAAAGANRLFIPQISR
jgi:YD repeat-containing protein